MGDIKTLEQCLAEMGWIMCVVPLIVILGFAALWQATHPKDVQR